MRMFVVDSLRFQTGDETGGTPSHEIARGGIGRRGWLTMSDGRLLMYDNRWLLGLLFVATSSQISGTPSTPPPLTPLETIAKAAYQHEFGESIERPAIY